MGTPGNAGAGHSGSGEEVYLSALIFSSVTHRAYDPQRVVRAGRVGAREDDQLILLADRAPGSQAAGRRCAQAEDGRQKMGGSGRRWAIAVSSRVTVK